jgi:hypothetical protein
MLRHVGRKAAYRIATSDLVEQLAMSAGISRHIAFRHARRYVAGLNADAALAVVHDLRESGLVASVDLFGEDVDDAATANGVVARYLSLAETLAGDPGTYL